MVFVLIAEDIHQEQVRNQEQVRRESGEKKNDVDITKLKKYETCNVFNSIGFTKINVQK